MEFGAELDIRVTNGWTRIEHHSFDAYNEADNRKTMIERFREREEDELLDHVFRDAMYDFFLLGMACIF